jgi:signal transduction histidine kinase
MTSFNSETDAFLNSLTGFSLLESLSSSALVLDPAENKTLWVNPAFLNLTHLTPLTIMEQPFRELVTLPTKVDCALCLGKPSSGKNSQSQSQSQAQSQNIGSSNTTASSNLEFHGAFVLSSTGERVRVKMKHSLLENGLILCIIDPFSEDITLTQAHSDFVSTVSHEFRTPLTSIKGFADTLLRYGTQLPADQQKRFISIIKDQADRLTRLVENLLTVSKLGAARMEMSYRSVPLSKTIEKVIQNVSSKVGQDKRQQESGGKTPLSWKFKTDVSEKLPEVWVDPDKFEQILLNLVDNAVKYSYPGSEVSVSAKPAPNQPDKLQIFIKDQGVGIPQEHLPKIFTKFSRIDNPLTREVEGTGLGLYITQALTKAMEGEINIESEPNVGTTFILTFSAATPEIQAAYHRKMSAENKTEDDRHG